MGVEAKSMEVKKIQQAVNEKSFSSKHVQEFIVQVKNEIQKITWTNREELIFYTKLVVGATFVFGMVIYGLDLVVQTILSGLNFLLYLISG